jgi:glycosyltransferase involved in cell wall biosynthesis
VIPAYPPAASQPFVVNEMIEVERAGHRLIVLPLYRGQETVQHGTFTALAPDRVLPARLVDLASVGLAVWVSCRHPVRTLRALAGLHRAAGANVWAHARILAVTPKALAAVWRLRKEGVVHVHAHFANQTADCAAILGTVAKVPFSFTAHAYDIYSRTTRLRNETLSWKVARAARALAVSDYGAELLRRRLPAEEGERVSTAYVGIPLELFQETPPRPDGAALRIVSVARYCEKKGLDVLVAACAVLRDRGVAFECEIFGDGPLREALEAQVREERLENLVHLRRPVSQEAVAESLRACDVFVLPCRQDRTGDMDGIPTVFMEAMATGRPVVSCAISGIPELVRDGETGLVVPPEDPVAVAEAVERLAGAPELRRRLGEQGRRLVERQHDQARNARRVLELLLEAAPRRC